MRCNFGCFFTSSSTQEVNERLVVKHRLRGNGLENKKKNFVCENATDCVSDPYHLLSVAIALDELMDLNPVV